MLTPTTARVTCLATLAVLAALPAAAPPIADPAHGLEGRDLLTFAKDSYAGNLRSFRFLACRYTHTKGVAATREDAFAGRLTADAVLDATWAFDGPNLLYEGRPRPLAAFRPPAGGAGKTSASFFPEGLLTDGTYTLRASPVLRHATIHKRWSADDGPAVTPFSVGVMGGGGVYSPDARIGRALAGEFDWEVKRVRREGGGPPLIAISLGRPGGLKGWRHEMDPARGCLSVTFSGADPVTMKRHYEARVTEARACTGGRWFPMRTVIVWDPDRPAAPWRVDVVEVTRLDVDGPPALADLALEIPAGVPVSDRDDPNAEFRTEHPLRVTAMDLPALASRCRAQAKPTWGNHRLLSFGVPAVLCLAGVALAYRLRGRGIVRTREKWVPAKRAQ